MTAHPTLSLVEQLRTAGAVGTVPVAQADGSLLMTSPAPAAHAASHAGAGSDPITSLGAVTMTGALDMDAQKITVDLDGDSYWSHSVDDVSSLFLGAGERYNFAIDELLITTTGGATGPTIFFGEKSSTGIALKRTSNTNMQVYRGDLAGWANLVANSIFAMSYFQLRADFALLWDTRARIYAPQDGQILMQNWDQTGFDLLQFGATDDTAPAWQKSGATFAARLADDSDYTSVTASDFDLSGGGSLGTHASRHAGAGSDPITTLGACEFTGWVGIGESTPLGPLHVKDGDAGSITPYVGGNEFIIESDGYTGMSILSPANRVGAIYFADPGSSYAGALQYDHTIDSMIFFTAAATQKLYINANGLLQFAGQTNTEPALKRNASALEVVLADDSGRANLFCSYLYADHVTANIADGFVRAGSTGHFYFQGKTELRAPLDGQLLLQNAAEDDFDLLQFGGTSATEPAWQKVGATFAARLANDSAYTSIAASALALEAAAPALTFTDTDGTDGWSMTCDGDNLTIQNDDSNDDGELVLDHHIRLFPSGPTLPLPVFTSEQIMQHTATINPGGAVNGYFILKDAATVTLGGAFSSYGVINEQSTVTGNSTSNTVAAYVFVNNMTLTSTLGNRPPVTHSFDSKPRLLASAALIACPEIVAFNDWTNLETTGTGQVTLDRWITVRATQYSPYYYNMLSSGVGSAITVTDRIGFEFGPIEKKAGGGTETITNQYGWLHYATSNVSTLNVGFWIQALTGATSNYGIVLDSDGGTGAANGGGGIWFGDGQDATVYYDGTDMVIDPDVVGSGRVLIGGAGDLDDMLLNSIEIDGDLNHDGTQLAFFNVALTTRAAALTTALTQISHTGPTTPDYAIATPIDSGAGSAWGFSTQDEFETIMSVILNLQTRLDELESKLQTYGLLQ